MYPTTLSGNMTSTYSSFQQAASMAATYSTIHVNSTSMEVFAEEMDNSLHCDEGALLGPLGLLVQVLLAAIAFGALVIKRFCEPKSVRRSWKIWFFDTSKQAIGAAVIHFANVFLSEVFHGDPCTWYIISFLLDSTVGLFIICLGLKISQVIIARKRWNTLTFGEYGSPPQCSAWIGQCGVYILVMVIEKVLMTVLVLFNFWKKVRRFIMSPIRDPKLELVIVMFIVPFIVNAIIFWVVDNFLKRQMKVSHPGGALDSNETAMRYFKATDNVKYYKKCEQGNDSGSDLDILLSAEEEVDFARSDMSSRGSMEQHRLLKPPPQLLHVQMVVRLVQPQEVGNCRTRGLCYL